MVDFLIEKTQVKEHPIRKLNGIWKFKRNKRIKSFNTEEDWEIISNELSELLIKEINDGKC